MNKKILAIVVTVLVAVGGGMAYLLASSADKTEMQDMIGQENTPSDKNTQNQAPKDTTSTQPGAYVDYSETAIADSTGTTLLFFHAPWCPQCRALESDIKSIGVPTGVTIIKVDYDSNQSLRQKYGVTLQTTVVRLDDQGNLHSKFVAYDDPSLDAVKAELL